MRFTFLIILFFLISCGSDMEKYEMIQFGKSNEKPDSEDALLVKIIRDKKELVVVVFPKEDKELTKLVQSLGKGDLIEIKVDELGGLKKGERLQLLDFKPAAAIGEVIDGLGVKLEEKERERLLRYFFNTDVDYEFKKGVFVHEKHRSRSGKKGIKNSIYRIAMECELLDGKKVYSTEKSADLFEFNKSMPDQVTEGLGVVMDMMEEGDELWAVVPSAISFGKTGIEKVIPPDEPLVYKLKLIEIII
ncbi:MAG: FKBP-type peptidyl-prolyl cis-trans isomerase [Crocinitomicaceae bacterium]